MFKMINLMFEDVTGLPPEPLPTTQAGVRRLRSPPHSPHPHNHSHPSQLSSSYYCPYQHIFHICGE